MNADKDLSHRGHRGHREIEGASQTRSKGCIRQVFFASSPGGATVGSQVAQAPGASAPYHLKPRRGERLSCRAWRPEQCLSPLRGSIVCPPCSRGSRHLATHCRPSGAETQEGFPGQSINETLYS